MPKSCEADAVLVSKSDTAYHDLVYQIYRDALGSAILYVSKTDSCSFRYSPWSTRLYYGNSMQTYKPGHIRINWYKIEDSLIIFDVFKRNLCIFVAKTI